MTDSPCLPASSTPSPRPLRPASPFHIRLSSGASVLFVTDVRRYDDWYFSHSQGQVMFEAGAIIVPERTLALVTFGRDDVRAMLRAGLPSCPWSAPLDRILTLTRYPHGQNPQGRFAERVDVSDASPDLLCDAEFARRVFVETRGFKANATPELWADLVRRDADRRAVMAEADRRGSYARADLAKLFPGVNLGPILRELVVSGRYVAEGSGRATRYLPAPPKPVTHLEFTATPDDREEDE